MQGRTAAPAQSYRAGKHEMVYGMSNNSEALLTVSRPANIRGRTLNLGEPARFGHTAVYRRWLWLQPLVLSLSG